MPVIAQASNDPILVLIDRHKVAFAEWIEVVNHLSDMEAAIPSELQRGARIVLKCRSLKLTIRAGPPPTFGTTTS
jgi:hypothetical protein